VSKIGNEENNPLISESSNLVSLLGVFETHPSDQKINLLIDQYEQNKKEYREMKENFEKRLLEERVNTITIFSIFTAFVAFISAEINIFSQVHSYWLFVGISLMLTSFILLFVLAVRNVAVNAIKWKDFFSPIITFLILLLILGIWVLEHNTKKANKIPSELKLIENTDFELNKSKLKNKI
jgi:hypothetical protein